MIGEIVNRAVSLHQAGQLAAAEPLYRQALAAGVPDPQILHLYAALLYQQQRMPEALTAVEASLKQAPGAADSLTLQGIVLMALGRTAQAVAPLAKAAAAAPRNADAWSALGSARAELGQLDEAVAAFDRSLAVQATPQAWANRAAALLRLDRAADALHGAENALAQAPRFGPSLYNYGQALWRTGRLEEALAAFERLLAETPNAAEVWAHRSALLYNLDRFEEALSSAGRALQLQPQSVTALTNRGHALRRLKRLEDAVSSFDQVVAISPDSQDGWRLRGEVLRDLNRSPDALESFERALALDPGSPVLEAARADMLMALRRYNEAVAGYDKAVAADPTRPEFWTNRSVALGIVQRFDEAAASIDRALAIAPGDPDAMLSKGKLLCEIGQVDEGLALLARRAAQIYGDLPEAPSPRESKQRHDQEQRDYLAARGVAAGNFHIDGGDRLAGPAVNPANRASAAASWAESDRKILVIDQLLTEPALEGLRRFCRGSTIWRTAYKQGYLGAFVNSGFACPLLAQIAEELQEVFPTVVGEHGLLSTWGFKYDSRLGGIRIHADQAAVNVNFWITPDEANLNPDSGGMVIWDAIAPADWDITRYNGDDDAVRAFLAENQSTSITVPYRANRAVIFDSDLFHETDRIEFKDGYLNRRINVTMLYGRRNFTNT